MIKNILLFFLITTTLLASKNNDSSEKDKYLFEEIGFNYNSNNKNSIKRKASYFPSDNKRAIVLVHQSGETMHSWYFFSNILQKHGMASIALENISVEDILGAIQFLKSKGYIDISLMGASLGGASVLRVMNSYPQTNVSKIILLAPAIGPALISDVQKLIVLAKNDFYSDKAYETYKEASSPKLLKEFTGRAHAQKLFKTEHRNDLISELLTFLNLSKK